MPIEFEAQIILHHVLCTVHQQDFEAVLAYRAANHAHLRPWEPLRTPDLSVPETMGLRLAKLEDASKHGAALHLVLKEPANQSIISEINFTNIVRGPFQACHLGFSLDSRWEGQGLMRAALAASIQWVFQNYGLHRIMANYMPENTRSARLLASLGFQNEGLAKSYLKINGVWTDHVLTSLIAPEPPVNPAE